MKLIVTVALATAVLIMDAKAEVPSDVISAMPCTNMGYGYIINHLSGRAPLGIDLNLWTKDVADLVLERVRACRGQVDEVQTPTRSALQILPRYLDQVVTSAQEVRASADRDRAYAVSQRIEAEKKKAREAEEAEAKAAAKAERQRVNAEEEVRQKADAAELKSRLDTLPSAVQKFLAEHPSIMNQPDFGREGGPRTLIILYSAELAFKVCREQFGGFLDPLLGNEFDPSIKEVKRRSAFVEKIMVVGFQIPEEKVVGTRHALGVDSGRGEMIERLRADPAVLKTCRQFEEMLDLAPTLR